MDLKLRLAQRQKLSMTLHMKQMIMLLQLSASDLLCEVNRMLESCVLLEVDEASHNHIHTLSSGFSPQTYCGRDTEQLAVPETLHGYLRWQLNFLALTPVEHLIAEILVDGINDRGYLTVMPDDVLCLLTSSLLTNNACPTLPDVLSILEKLQTLEPAGIAARTHQECLSLQVARANVKSRLRKSTLYLLETCYPHLANNNYLALQKKTGLSVNTLTSALKLIRSLDPSPGWAIGGTSVTDFRVPDVVVFKKAGRWYTQLNKDVSPVLKVNPVYADVVAALSSSDGENDVDLWRQQLKDARCFVRGLNNRYSTLLQVMHLLVEKQGDFLDNGEEHMQALSMRSVAMELGVHESTVSRVVQNKYVQTPRGVIAMNYFFSPDTCRQGVSSVALQAHIRQLIIAEDQTAPLSDTHLQQALKQLNINVARRTVAKYRKELGFASSRQRKYQ